MGLIGTSLDVLFPCSYINIYLSVALPKLDKDAFPKYSSDPLCPRSSNMSRRAFDKLLLMGRYLSPSRLLIVLLCYHYLRSLYLACLLEWCSIQDHWAGSRIVVKLLWKRRDLKGLQELAADRFGRTTFLITRSRDGSRLSTIRGFSAT